MQRLFVVVNRRRNLIDGLLREVALPQQLLIALKGQAVECERLFCLLHRGLRAMKLVDALRDGKAAGVKRVRRRCSVGVRGCEIGRQLGLQIGGVELRQDLTLAHAFAFLDVYCSRRLAEGRLNCDVLVGSDQSGQLLQGHDCAVDCDRGCNEGTGGLGWTRLAAAGQHEGRRQQQKRGNAYNLTYAHSVHATRHYGNRLGNTATNVEITPPGARVLVVDDEAAIRDLLEYGLGQAGFDVRSARDGKAAMELVRSWTPEVIVLDVMLPEIDGFTLLPALRRLTDVPILMLSAKTETAEKITGLARGADDYLGKPFEIEELIARLHSALRRPRLQQRETFRYADLVIDVSRHAVHRGKRRIDLSTREFDLLLTFVQHPERVFTRAQLLDLVWGVDRDVVPNTVETYVSYLRAKIDSGEEVKLIQTLRGVGYVLRANPSP